MSKAFIFFLLTLSGLQGFAQTCQIISNNSVCKEELISFNVTSSATIQSVLWDMGDASSSTQINFNHKYSSAGVKDVKVTVTTSSGTCVATQKVTVYELPKFNASIKKDNIYCLSKNKVCFIDSSTAGETGLTISKRIVIWDDGDQTSTNDPTLGSVVCHNYKNAGKFKVTVEHTNDKGCKATGQLNVIVLQDAVPAIQIVSVSGSGAVCDSTKVTFNDVTGGDTSEVIGKIFDWGNGKRDTVRSKALLHYYYKVGNYNLSLTYLHKNGCVNTTDSTVYVFVANLFPNIKKNRDTICYDNVLRLQQIDGLTGATYNWHIGGNPGVDEQGKDVFVFPPEIGKVMIKLQILYQGCEKTFERADSIESVGIVPKVTVLNDDQCDNKDTVYFRVDGLRHLMGNLTFLWELDDSLAPTCTTSIKKGINVKGNCNYSTDSIFKHKYVYGIKRHWKLQVTDNKFGCYILPIDGYVNTLKPPDYKFIHSAKRYCMGLMNPDNEMVFGHGLSPNVKVGVNLDSANGRKFFTKNWVPSYIYQSVADKKGWVTVGLSATFGQPIIYRSFDSSDYYIDSSRVCYDTLWKHNWFRLLASPIAAFSLSVNFPQCVPATVRTTLLKPIQEDMVRTIWEWGDSSKNDTFNIFPGYTVMPRPTHVYKKVGIYFIKNYFENKNGCISISGDRFAVGFVPKLKLSDDLICPGETVYFNDSVYYISQLDTNIQYWHMKDRRKSGSELLRWDFDDGRGFETDTLYPAFTFPNAGTYNIRLAVKDKYGCWDTVSRTVRVSGVHAGIKAVTGKLICDEIIQLFDSSSTDHGPPIDSIAKYYWEFDDSGNPSYLRDPYHFYRTFKDYTILHIAENTQGCKDTVTLKIKIEGPVADFDIIGDTVGCAPFTAEFKNLSLKGRDYIWYFGDPLKSKLSTNRDTNARFTYTQPGVYYVYLLASDSMKNPNSGNSIYYCKSFFPDSTITGHAVRKIIVLPSPKADFIVNPVICKGKSVIVTDNSDTLYKLYRWEIPGIDSIETANKSGELQILDTGKFTINFKPWYPPQGQYNMSCGETISKTVRVTEMIADFDIFKDTTSCPVFTFTNTSKGVKTVQWNLGDPSAGVEKNVRHDLVVTHTYSMSNGAFTPCLYVKNAYGCRDSICKTVDVELITKLMIPNVFTPNGDGLNDDFDILIQGVDEYDLTIFNRWGQEVFHSGKDDTNWTGRMYGQGEFFPESTYFYIFRYKFKCDGESHKAQGTIALIRPKE